MKIEESKGNQDFFKKYPVIIDYFCSLVHYCSWNDHKYCTTASIHHHGNTLRPDIWLFFNKQSYRHFCSLNDLQSSYISKIWEIFTLVLLLLIFLVVFCIQNVPDGLLEDLEIRGIFTIERLKKKAGGHAQPSS